MTNLISTIISATAGLVAIIGGFLVSRVITLSSERNSIERKLQEINSEITSKSEMVKKINAILLESNIDDFFDEYAEDILIYKKSILQILEEDSSISLTIEELEPYVKDLNKIFDNVVKLI